MIDDNVEIIEVEQAEIAPEDLQKLREEYEARRHEMLANVEELGRYIADIANKAVKDKQFLEDRAIDDYRQKQGFKTSDDYYKGRSTAQYSLTSVKCSAAKAKLNDILFPTGEVNFTVEPDAAGQDEQIQAAEKMTDVIGDYLDDSNYDHVGRKCISDCVDLGVGIIEGPIPGARIIKKWTQSTGPNGQPVNSLAIEIDTKSPIVEHVPWWDYYPDLSVAEQKDCAFEFRRRMFNSAELELLLVRDDFNQHAIKKMLSDGADSEEPYYLQQLRDDAPPKGTSDTWCVYSGYMRVPGDKLKKIFDSEHEDFEICAADHGVNEFDEYDVDIECVVWVSKSGDLLKISPNPYEMEQRGFRTVCFDRDTSCFMASKGIPRLMHWQQLQINNLMRRLDDNSSLSSVPQFIYDPFVVEPVPSKPGPIKFRPEDYIMYGGKGWRAKQAGVDIRKAIWFFSVPSNSAELLAELNVYIRQADEVTMLPDVLLGEQSAAMTKTFHGMELLANNALTIQQRVIKDWDDNITVPLITGYIDYVMQFKPIAGVQGVFTANAKGSSGLLMKETRSRNMLNAVQLANSNQEFHGRTNWDKLYDESLQALQLEPDKVVLTEEEKQQNANQPPPPNPEIEKIKLGQAELQMKKYVADQTVAVAKLRVEEERYRLAIQLQSTERLTDKKLQAKEKEILLKSRAEESKMANEYLIERTGEARI